MVGFLSEKGKRGLLSVMLCNQNIIQLSASDLIGHLNCSHLTNLDHAVALGTREKPKFWDPLLEILRQRGLEHEQSYIEHLRSTGLDIVRIEGEGITNQQVEQTVAAMRSGEPIIVQAALQNGVWGGRADVLQRIASPSKLGDWSYEVIDTKLARETMGGTVLQLCLYTELVSKVQGAVAEHMKVVTPWSDFEPQIYRTSDYLAYYRLVKQSLEFSVSEKTKTSTYPDPKEHCDVCRWRLGCEERRRADDHLCLVAGASNLQINELKRQGVVTTTALARVPLPLSWKPERGAIQTYERIREQARIQIEGREKSRPVFEALEPEPGLGLARLPEPSTGDIFFDLEGDPFVGDGGLEYLFGHVVIDDVGAPKYSAQ